MDGIRRRARAHAALGDATRLRIVDALQRTDASPKDLQAALDLPSNLLAHHLQVLEQAGLLSRRRSEGDRRRTYLTLELGALSEVVPASTADDATPVTRVVFVCTANSARSQLAAALWQNGSEVPAASAGTHPARRVAPGASAVARRHRLDLTGAVPRELAEVVRPDDFLVSVCDSAHENLLAAGTPTPVHWSVPDPVQAADPAAFEAAFGELAARVTSLAPRLRVAR